MKQHSKNRLDEERLISFARPYLAESFPNPDRIGCPSKGALRRLAESPTTADLSITEHLGCCSPCFQEYQQLLAEVKARKRPLAVVWNRLKSIPIVVILGVLVLVVLGISFALWKSNNKDVAHQKPTPVHDTVVASYVPFVLDLRTARIVRGNPENSHFELAMPRMPLHISVYLPAGADSGQYSVSLERNGNTVWATTATATMQNHRMVLEFESDLSSFPQGQYMLVLLSTHGMRLRQTVILQETTTKTLPPRITKTP